MTQEPSSKKELQKVEAFKEHVEALQKHVFKTQAYLNKEVGDINNTIRLTKELIKDELGIDLSQDKPMQSLEEDEERYSNVDEVKVVNEVAPEEEEDRDDEEPTVKRE